MNSSTIKEQVIQPVNKSQKTQPKARLGKQGFCPQNSKLYMGFFPLSIFFSIGNNYKLVLQITSVLAWSNQSSERERRKRGSNNWISDSIHFPFSVVWNTINNLCRVHSCTWSFIESIGTRKDQFLSRPAASLNICLVWFLFWPIVYLPTILLVHIDIFFYLISKISFSLISLFPQLMSKCSFRWTSFFILSTSSPPQFLADSHTRVIIQISRN